MSEKQAKQAFNQLSPKEWVQYSRSVWNIRTPPRNQHQFEHGATFPATLVGRVIKLYSQEGDLILDPFLGTGTTLVVAKKLKRYGIGLELYEKYATIAKQSLIQMDLWEEYPQRVICDDCRNLLQYVEPNSVQLMLTSPPYADFIHRSVQDRKKSHKNSILVTENLSTVKPYGDDQRDFGNLDYESFLHEIKDLMRKLLIATKPGGYNIWVVKDHRDPQNGRPLIPLHSDLAKAGEEVGFKWHDLIIWDQNEQRKLVLLGYPSAFYVNINHTFLVVLRKPYNRKEEER